MTDNLKFYSKYLPVEVSDVTLIVVSLLEAPGDCEDHHGVAVEGDVHGEGVQVVLGFRKFVQESDNT